MAARRVLIAARWLVGLGLLIMVHQAAQAASMTVYVDPAGDCGGMSPCYPSMSQALSEPRLAKTIPATRIGTARKSVTASLPSHVVLTKSLSRYKPSRRIPPAEAKVANTAMVVDR